MTRFPTPSQLASTRSHRLPKVCWLKPGLAGLLIVVAVAPGASAQAPDIRVSPTSVDFGRVTGSKSKRVMIQNKGGSDLLVDTIARCTGTSTEFEVAPSSATVAPKKKATLEVTYSPADDGSDTGCLEILSNDPDTATTSIALSGSAKSSATPATDVLRLRPSSLDFGDVATGSAATLAVSVQSHGQALPEVVVNRCFETSDEFSFTPQVPFRVAPGNAATIRVTYTPVDAPDVDRGCLEVRSGISDHEPALLRVRAAGVETIDGVDLDIHDFKVKKDAKVDSGQKIKIQLWIKNPGTVDETRTAQVLGEQNGEAVYEEELDVRDRVGNQGVTKYTFPVFQPSEPGDILWTATIDDDDPDEDRRMAITRVSEKAAPSTGVDLDIRRFNATQSVILGQRPVRLRLKVRNNGTVDEQRAATVVGMQKGVEIHSDSLSVSDSVGDRGSTVYRFESFQPSSTGDILWIVVVSDDDPDLDEALAVTSVTAGD